MRNGCLADPNHFKSELSILDRNIKILQRPSELFLEEKVFPLSPRSANRGLKNDQLGADQDELNADQKFAPD
jgi:hypothetical protein